MNCRAFTACLLLLMICSAAGAVNVITAPAASGDIRELLAFTGEIKPFEETFLTSDINGLIEKVMVETGQLVKAGEPLVLVDKARLLMSVRLSEAQIGKATQAVKEARSDFERNKILFEKKVLNEKAYEMAETAYLNAQNTLKEAETSLELAKLNLSRDAICAPINGWFVNRNVFRGMGVMPGQTLGKIVDLKKVFVEARISENQINKIRIGQKCALSGGIPGKVAHIDLYGDSSRSFLVKILVDNPDLHFKANMYVKGEIVIQDHCGVPLIPIVALITDPDATYVFVVEENKAHRRVVQVVAREGDRCFAQGIEAGESVVTIGQGTLKEGTEVSHAEAMATTQPATMSEVLIASPTASQTASPVETISSQ